MNSSAKKDLDECLMEQIMRKLCNGVYVLSRIVARKGVNCTYQKCESERSSRIVKKMRKVQRENLL